MANITYEIGTKKLDLPRLTARQMVALGELAFDSQRRAIVAMREDINADEALAALRRDKGDPFLTWRYVRSIEGSLDVLEKVQVSQEDIDAMDRAQMIELVGLLCGFDVQVTKDRDEVNDRPTEGASGNT